MPEARITLATPALLFSAISLLMLAFTNRFLALASLVRNLHALYKEKPNEVLYGQIRNLRLRISLIRWMQILGITSLLLCVFSMTLIYVGSIGAAEVVFGLGPRADDRLARPLDLGDPDLGTRAQPAPERHRARRQPERGAVVECGVVMTTFAAIPALCPLARVRRVHSGGRLASAGARRGQGARGLASPHAAGEDRPHGTAESGIRVATRHDNRRL